MVTCPTCGNNVDAGLTRCLYCAAEIEHHTTESRRPQLIYKTINLERGRPVAESALRRMHVELEQAKLSGVKIVSLIHGYGSSGKGGIIRAECRKSLDYLVQRGDLRKAVPGETFHKSSGVGKSLVRQYPELKTYCKSDFNNPGITVVEF